jgi:hypothetical protein
VQEEDEFLWKKSKVEKNAPQKGYVHGSAASHFKDSVATGIRARASSSGTYSTNSHSSDSIKNYQNYFKILFHLNFPYTDYPSA